MTPPASWGCGSTGLEITASTRPIHQGRDGKQIGSSATAWRTPVPAATPVSQSSPPRYKQAAVLRRRGTGTASILKPRARPRIYEGIPQFSRGNRNDPGPQTARPSSNLQMLTQLAGPGNTVWVIFQARSPPPCRLVPRRHPGAGPSQRHPRNLLRRLGARAGRRFASAAQAPPMRRRCGRADGLQTGGRQRPVNDRSGNRILRIAEHAKGTRSPTNSPRPLSERPRALLTLWRSIAFGELAPALFAVAVTRASKATVELRTARSCTLTALRTPDSGQRSPAFPGEASLQISTAVSGSLPATAECRDPSAAEKRWRRSLEVACAVTGLRTAGRRGCSRPAASPACTAITSGARREPCVGQLVADA